MSGILRGTEMTIYSYLHNFLWGAKDLIVWSLKDRFNMKSTDVFSTMMPLSLGPHWWFRFSNEDPQDKSHFELWLNTRCYHTTRGQVLDHWYISWSIWDSSNTSYEVINKTVTICVCSCLMAHDAFRSTRLVKTLLSSTWTINAGTEGNYSFARSTVGSHGKGSLTL